MTAADAPSRDELAALLYDLLALTTLEPLPHGDAVAGLPGRWSPRPDGEPGARVELAAGETILVHGVETGGTVDLESSGQRIPRSGAVALDAEHGVVVFPFPDAVGGEVWVGVTASSAPRLRDFRGISAYPVDDRWRIPVSFTPAGEGEQLSTIRRGRTGGEISMTRAGWFDATIEGERYRLTVDRVPEYAYVNVRDAGSGVESYAAGRVIRLLGDPEDIDVLDFNEAAVPPCAFNPLINCPLPPQSNTIDVVVRAGQREVLFG